jgi:CDP-paratose 2-epimerase
MRPILITGGAGFLGANLADRLALEGAQVRLLDNLSRRSVERNLVWLDGRHGDRIQLEQGDVRDPDAVRAAVSGAGMVFHFAAQVAVTTSLLAPELDFAINAGGTLQVLEAVRAQPEPPPLVYASTSKVYGALADLKLVERETRYAAEDPQLAARGIDERRPLELQSPYGCSKGAADQYVLDWARSFGLPALVFRMGSIYGPRQFGTEDQGWVAHLYRASRAGQPLTLYGDGKQVRDLLFIDDLVEAFLIAARRFDELRGRAFNLGGGPAHTLSLLELIAHLEQVIGRPPEVRCQPWRVGDQRYYVSDTRLFEASTGWYPRVPIADGLARLRAWLDEEPAVATAHPEATCA